MATLTAGNFGRRPGWRMKHRVLPAAAARGGRDCDRKGLRFVWSKRGRSEGEWVEVCVGGGGIVSLVGLRRPPFPPRSRKSVSSGAHPVALLPGASDGPPAASLPVVPAGSFGSSPKRTELCLGFSLSGNLYLIFQAFPS